jgi:CHAT domain-containing protein
MTGEPITGSGQMVLVSGKTVEAPARFRQRVDLVRGVPYTPEGIEFRIETYESILRGLPQNEAPDFWGAIQHNLGYAYSLRANGYRAENLERELAAYDAALEVRTQVDSPFDWATTKSNLSGAYYARIRGDRAENLEKAIEVANDALQVFTQENFPIESAGAHINLALAYTNRVNGTRAENLEQAIAALDNSLKVFTYEEFPMQWASVQNNLGNAYAQRLEGNRAENLNLAIADYINALQLRTQRKFPVLWATTQHNLGNAYSELIAGDRAQNLEKAIAAYDAALKVRTGQNYPEDWADTKIGLGAAYTRRILGSRIQNLKQASENFLDAANIKKPDDGFARHINKLQDLNKTTLGTIISQFVARIFPDQAEANVHPTIHACLWLCLHFGLWREALELIEASKVQLFTNRLALQAFPAPLVPPAQLGLLREERTLLEEIGDLAIAAGGKSARTHARRFSISQKDKLAALDDVWSKLEPYAPDYVSMRRGEPVRYEKVQNLLDGFDVPAALVEFYLFETEESLMLISLVLKSGQTKPVMVKAVPVSQADLSRLVTTYFREVVEFRQHGDIGQRWQELAEPIFSLTDILPHLNEAKLMYLVPNNTFSYLPLHALQMKGDYLIDRFPIVYAPSAALLGSILQRAAKTEHPKQPRTLVVGNPTFDLNYAENEARQVAELFGVSPYLGSDATKVAIQSELPGKDLVHMACHSFFHSSDPMQSGMVLAGNRRLSVYDIAGIELQADLVTLSSCESALNAVFRPGEFVGLPQAFLWAGASSVLSALWTVDDEFTGKLMANFYNRLYDKSGHKANSKAVALQQAVLEMRKSREHPYYWAPFTLMGAWQ